MHSPVAPIPQHLPRPQGSSETVPLAVDLDGTLVRTDLLVECLSRRLRQPSRWLETLAGIVGMAVAWIIERPARANKAERDRIDDDLRRREFYEPIPS